MNHSKTGLLASNELSDADLELVAGGRGWENDNETRIPRRPSDPREGWGEYDVPRNPRDPRGPRM